MYTGETDGMKSICETQGVASGKRGLEARQVEGSTLWRGRKGMFGMGREKCCRSKDGEQEKRSWKRRPETVWTTEGEEEKPAVPGHRTAGDFSGRKEAEQL